LSQIPLLLLLDFTQSRAISTGTLGPSCRKVFGPGNSAFFNKHFPLCFPLCHKEGIGQFAGVNVIHIGPRAVVSIGVLEEDSVLIPVVDKEPQRHQGLGMAAHYAA
jgi:hypothetical protein